MSTNKETKNQITHTIPTKTMGILTVLIVSVENIVRYQQMIESFTAVNVTVIRISRTKMY